MKKILLIGISLLTVMGASAQALAKKHPAGTMKLCADKYRWNETKSNSAVPAISNIPSTPVVNGKSAGAAGLTINWTAISKSINAFGVLGSAQKQLDYDEDLNAVIFIHRKSPHYPMNPAPTTTGAISGGIVAMVTTDWGNTWDSTLVWNNSTWWARYPQGGFYNPNGNTNLSNAYAVVSGPVTSQAASPPWGGIFLGSKNLGQMTNVAGPGNQNRFYSNENTTNADSVKKVDAANNDYCVGNDGVVRILGWIANDYSFVNPFGFRGARIIKGQFSAGAFLWTSDSISLFHCPVEYDAPTLNFNVLDGQVNMAWSESGAVGYLWFIGIRNPVTTGVTGNNRGLQPIVWKTTDNGLSWTLLPLINFNDTVTFKAVLKQIEKVDSVGDDSKIPYFSWTEDIAGAVDKNDNLHLVSTLMSTRKSDPALLGMEWEYTNSAGDGQTYRYKHDTHANDNYMWDFTTIQGGQSWSVTVVDTLETEHCGRVGLGVGSNPYTDDPQNVGARIQVSRSTNGEYIVYNWADSKYLFTTNAYHWNTRPDIYVRMRHADSARVHPMKKVDLTGFPGAGDVYTAAYMHHSSPKVWVDPTSNMFNTKITLPVKVTNSNPLVANTENRHHYGSAVMSFTLLDVSVAENGMISAQSSVLFPNPAKENAQLSINLKDNSTVDITVMNIVGQQVSSTSTKAMVGDNNININLDGLSTGVYMVNIKVGDASVTKKLVVE